MRSTSFPFPLQRSLSSALSVLLAVLMLWNFALIAQADVVESLSYEHFKSSSAEVESGILSDGSLQVVLAAGAKASPGVIVLPDSGEVRDFSKYSRIEAVIQNTGDSAVPVSLRVDNEEHWKTAPWSNEAIRLAPGETGTVVVFFGYSHGMKPSFPLDRSRVTQLLFFAPGSEQTRRFVVKSISVAGAPDETPEMWQNQAGVVPESGGLLGPNSPVDSSRQLSSFNGAAITATESGDRLQVQFTGASQQASFRPLSGQWDLRAANRLAVEVINSDTETAWPGIRIESSGGSTSIARSAAPLGAGAKAVIIVPFSASAPNQKFRRNGTRSISPRAIRSRSSSIFAV